MLGAEKVPWGKGCATARVRAATKQYPAIILETSYKSLQTGSAFNRQGDDC